MLNGSGPRDGGKDQGHAPEHVPRAHDPFELLLVFGRLIGRCTRHQRLPAGVVGACAKAFDSRSMRSRDGAALRIRIR